MKKSPSLKLQQCNVSGYIAYSLYAILAFQIDNWSNLMLMTIDTTYTKFELPLAVKQRLQWLLDHQNTGKLLSDAERLEAASLVEIAEFLSLLQLRAERLNQVS